MAKAKTIYTATVGSKMHGLSTPTSDEDIRYVVKLPLIEIISPFHNNEIKVAGTEDVESWELQQFVKHLTQGNPTAYEVIATDIYDDIPSAKRLRDTFPLYYEPRKILLAHIGYTEAQLKRYLRPFIGMMEESKPIVDSKSEEENAVIAENRMRRAPKAIVAGYRVLAQGTQLLKQKTFCAKVKDYSVALHEKLMAIKTIAKENITLEFLKHHNDELEKSIKELKNQFELLSEEEKNQKPDLEGVKEYLLKEYTTYEVTSENHLSETLL